MYLVFLNHSFIMVNGQDGTIQSTDSLMSAGLCEELFDPDNGTVMVTSLTKGSVANYTCNGNDTYQLTGSESRTCMDNGMWSGEEPTCLRTYQECICDVYAFTSKIRP